jgi:hypothetical protein
MPVIPSSGQVESGGKKTVVAFCVTTHKFYRQLVQRSMRKFHANVIILRQTRAIPGPESAHELLISRCNPKKKAPDCGKS